VCAIAIRWSGRGRRSQDGRVGWPVPRPRAPSRVGAINTAWIPHLRHPRLVLCLPPLTVVLAASRPAPMEPDEDFRLLAEHASDVVVRGDNDGVLQWVSPSVSSMFGWRPEELIGHRFVEFVADEDASTVVATGESLRRGEACRVEVRLRTADGRTRWISASMKPVLDDAGTVVGRVGGWRDVQRDVEARDAAAESEARYRLLAEQASDVVCLTGPDRRITWIAPSVSRLLGWSVDELIETRLVDLIHLEDRPACERAVRRVDDGVVHSIEFSGTAVRFRCRDGRFRWLSGTATGVVDASGCVREVISGLRDVHELVVAKQALDAERMLLRATMDSLLDPQVVVEAVRGIEGGVAGLVVVHANASAAELLHRPRQELDGAPLTEVLSDLGVSGLIDACMATIESGAPTVLDEVELGPLLSRDGQRFDLRAARVGDGLTITWRDVTDRYQANLALAAAEEHYKLLAENASDIVFRADLDAVVEWISPSVREVLGQAPDEVIGKSAATFIHPDDLASLAESRIAVGDDQRSSYEARFRRTDGTYRWMSVVARPVRDESGAIIGRAGGFRDIQAEVEARTELSQAEQRLRLAIEAAPAGMAVVDLDRRFVEVNAALCNMLGRERGWMLHHGLADIIGPDDDKLDLRTRADASALGHDRLTMQKLLRRADGAELWVEHSIGVIRDGGGVPTSYLSQFVDITDVKAHSEQLHYDANHDPLTRLANRRMLLERAGALLTRGPRTGSLVAVLFVDVDGLKGINDTWGHHCGDLMLTEVASRITSSVRVDDVVARFGGDEFVVLLTSIRVEADAVAVAENIRHAIAAPITTDHGELDVTASIGLTVARSGEDPHEALHRADAALYRAKRSGRDRTVVHVPSVDTVGHHEPGSFDV
jgi:diguanylate cyclase (GGDEF)-like protein/PAS domain S-box-containing protein